MIDGRDPRPQLHRSEQLFPSRLPHSHDWHGQAVGLQCVAGDPEACVLDFFELVAMPFVGILHADRRGSAGERVEVDLTKFVVPPSTSVLVVG